MAFLRRNEGHRRRTEAGEGRGTEGFVSIRSNGLSFLMFLQRELRIKGLLLPKEREREREKNTKPTKAVKTFGLSVGAENAKQIGGIFPTMPLKCAAVLGSPSPFAHCVVFGWCISSGELRAGSQGFPCVLCSDH